MTVHNKSYDSIYRQSNTNHLLVHPLLFRSAHPLQSTSHRFWKCTHFHAVSGWQSFSVEKCCKDRLIHFKYSVKQNILSTWLNTLIKITHELSQVSITAASPALLFVPRKYTTNNNVFRRIFPRTQNSFLISACLLQRSLRDACGTPIWVGRWRFPFPSSTPFFILMRKLAEAYAHASHRFISPC